MQLTLFDVLDDGRWEISGSCPCHCVLGAAVAVAVRVLWGAQQRRLLMLMLLSDAR